MSEFNPVALVLGFAVLIATTLAMGALAVQWLTRWMQGFLPGFWRALLVSAASFGATIVSSTLMMILLVGVRGLRGDGMVDQHVPDSVFLVLPVLVGTVAASMMIRVLIRNAAGEHIRLRRALRIGLLASLISIAASAALSVALAALMT